MEKKLRACRKCLLKELSKEEYFAELDAYIENLDPEVRVDQALYEERLTICGTCPRLTDGMCSLCGCFVELRAALRVRKCPDIPSRWAAVQKREG